MKIKPEDYEHLKAAILGNSKAPTLPQFLAGQKPGGPKRTEAGWRHCLISVTPGLTQWVCDVLYRYMDDTHLDTALRKITADPTLKGE